MLPRVVTTPPFIFQGPTGGGFARDNVDIIHLGALFGNGAITAPVV